METKCKWKALTEVGWDVDGEARAVVAGAANSGAVEVVAEVVEVETSVEDVVAAETSVEAAVAAETSVEAAVEVASSADVEAAVASSGAAVAEVVEDVEAAPGILR